MNPDPNPKPLTQLLAAVQGAVLADLLDAAREAFALWHWVTCDGGMGEEGEASPTGRRAGFLKLLQAFEAQSPYA